MKVSLALFSIATMTLTGCATQLHRGVVAMKIDESTAHVGLNRNEVKIGDEVRLYSDVCTPKLRGEKRTCSKKEKGHGKVSEVVNENYVTVKFEPTVEFKEGDFVEKDNH